MAGGRNAHLTLVDPQHKHMTSRIPTGFWSPWVDLMAEAKYYGLERQRARLQLQMETSMSVEGWGTDKLVEAMNGEPAQKAASAAAGVIPGQAPMLEATPQAQQGAQEAQTGAQRGQDAQQGAEQTKKPRRRLRLGRLR